MNFNCFIILKGNKKYCKEIGTQLKPDEVKMFRTKYNMV